MCRHNFRIAASIIICFLVQTQGADNYTDENRPYEFGFEVQVEGTKQQHRHEEKDKDGIIKGEFGFITADDVYHVTVYATDKDGHFKILSMKNIHLKSTTASAIGISSSTRQGPALGLSESTKSPVTQVTSAPAAIPGIQLAPEKAQPFQTQAVSTITNNYTPQKTVALEPQTSFTPVPEPSPVRACSACSLPTSPKPPRPVPQVSDINSGSQPIRSNGAPNNPQLSPTIIINTHSKQQQQSKAPQYPRFSNEQLNSQTPAQSAFPLHESPNTQQALQPSLISNPQQGVSVADSEQNYHNELSQSSYPQQVPSIPTKASMFSQQPSQSSYTGQGPLVQPSPQQTSQSTYPIQGESALGISQPNFPHISQSLYLGGLSSLASKQPPTQQPSQAIYPAGSDSGGGQTPTQSAYPLQESSNTQQALQPSLISNPQQGVSVANSEQNYPNKLSQSSYPQQNPFIPYKASLFSQQPSQLSYPGQGPLVQPNPQQTSQLTYPVQGESALGISQPNFPHTSQSSYHGGLSSLASKEPLAQQPSQAIFPAGSDSGGRATLEQSNKSTYPVYESPIAGNGQPYSKQQGVVGGERTPKQYNEPQESVDLGQQGQAKPKLVSVDIQIVDKNTDIHALQPGEKEGLPGGLSAHDMSRLLYIFNYTVGFHGHFEEGFENGVKKGYYYVTGRNGVRTRIDYVADGTGFHPKVSQEVLDLLSDDVPKPETEKDAKYGLKSYEFKWLYYPVGS